MSLEREAIAELPAAASPPLGFFLSPSESESSESIGRFLSSWAADEDAAALS